MPNIGPTWPTLVGRCRHVVGWRCPIGDPLAVLRTRNVNYFQMAANTGVLNSDCVGAEVGLAALGCLRAHALDRRSDRRQKRAAPPR
jgi:hypothetical protein